MAREKKKENLTLEERLQAALVPESEQPYKVPENWCWVSLQTIDQYQSSNIDPSKHPDTLFELYSVPSSADNYPEIIMGCEIGSTKQSVKKGDVLLCKINPRINRVWKVAQHTENILLASSEWIIIRNSKMNSDYLMYCFRAPYFREYMLSNVSGVGGSLMRAQPKYVKTYPIPVPPFAEQQRIVDRIESLFAKLDEAKQKAQDALDSFETRKAAILHKAFTGELTAQWRKKHDIARENWIMKPLSKVTNNHDSQRIPLSQAERSNLSRIYDYYGASGVIDKVDRFIFEGKNLLIGEDGANLVTRSKPIAFIAEGQYWVNNHAHVLSTTSEMLLDFLCYYINSIDLTPYVTGSAQPKMTQAKMNKIPIPVPMIDEQTEIVRILDDLLAKEQQAKEAAEKVLEQIDLIKKSILARAFRGELGTNDPTEQSAVELLRQVLSTSDM